VSEEAKTVLIVDDEALVQTTFKVLLEHEGYHVLLADDGNQALQQVRTRHVDLVVKLVDQHCGPART
jgi:CheY-like chemotaxis protein